MLPLIYSAVPCARWLLIWHSQVINMYKRSKVAVARDGIDGCRHGASMALSTLDLALLSITASRGSSCCVQSHRYIALQACRQAARLGTANCARMHFCVRELCKGVATQQLTIGINRSSAQHTVGRNVLCTPDEVKALIARQHSASESLSLALLGLLLLLALRLNPIKISDGFFGVTISLCLISSAPVLAAPFGEVRAEEATLKQSELFILRHFTLARAGSGTLEVASFLYQL
eukprot:13706-Heterococcus_DN1.PRE.1